MIFGRVTAHMHTGGLAESEVPSMDQFDVAANVAAIDTGAPPTHPTVDTKNLQGYIVHA
jgi:hypothetical protein